jgi:hypothetical protein
MFCEQLGHLERSAIKNVVFGISYGVPDIWMVDENAHDIPGCKKKQAPYVPSKQGELRTETNAPKKDKKAAREERKLEKKAEKKARKIALKEDKDYFKSSWKGKEFYRSLAHYLPELKKIVVRHKYMGNKYQVDRNGKNNGLQLFTMWLTCGFDRTVEVKHLYDD